MDDRIRLWTEPTPVHPVPRLAEALGLHPERLLMKRDDLIGWGGGGNKARKLERSLGRALARGATTVVTTGAAQSNHARMTAAAGATLGLDVVLVLEGHEVAPRGNVLLDGLYGARIEWSGDEGAGSRAGSVVAELEAAGTRVHRVAFGGSDAHSVQGFVDAGHELRDQVGDVDHVVVALGSGGTMAGLVEALGPERVLGVHCGAVEAPRTVVAGFLEERGTGIGADRLRIDEDRVGAGYAHLTDEARSALVLVARTTGILLDPTYTARAAAGLAAAARSGSIGADDRIVLWHSGGVPGLFGHAELGA
ncbi:1-aminocyclopropane-1-carboxylate deaminase/D-cysteine desulfhydrase-like pyridoxal-dependent ACC family enzyme [Clavibacter sp. B3I6]|uniref:pyridoxal-phosphate dependent enzyme n=1 Tax=Clavibacter sp. B3I6 TaxID=3042268 RepID=UPI00278146F3|nr:pyridoxal-phosphate dependent enzyme [Clavibacter sp. B3I6]MDQ0743486.1 1-aminocyclopropane-1-carboxylate deaminase/D-cysteine desulfhydrase-like pyridoxal-dependent ACC family enzyme [Clavibacter sp. B3I6]